MERIKVESLPKWIVADTLPAFYETEGATAIQMVAKLYNKVKELIESYNELVVLIDGKFDEQDEEIANAIDYMKTHLVQTLQELFNQALADGDISVELAITYDETNEELTLGVVGVPDGNEVEF